MLRSLPAPAPELLPHPPPLERRRRPEALVAGGVSVVVVHAEQERILGLPALAQRGDVEDGIDHPATLARRAQARQCPTSWRTLRLRDTGHGFAIDILITGGIRGDP